MTREEEVEKWVQAEPDERELEQSRRDELVYSYPIPTDDRG